MLFRIEGSTTPDDTTASFSVSSSDPAPAAPAAARAMAVHQIKGVPTASGQEGRERSPAIRGRGRAGTASRPAALVDRERDRGRRKHRRAESEESDEGDVGET